MHKQMGVRQARPAMEARAALQAALAARQPVAVPEVAPQPGGFQMTSLPPPLEVWGMAGMAGMQVWM